MPDRPPTLLRAAWVAPIGAPAFRDGALLVAGDRIVAVGNAKDLAREHPGASVEDYGDAVILPGLVNAHCHLELSHLSPPPKPKSFVDWLAVVMAPSSQPASVADSVQAGVEESLRFGVTLVGDISKEPQTARAVVSGSALAAVSYGEVVGMAGRRHLLGPRLAAALDPSCAGARLHIGVSPHAPYSIDRQGYRTCIDSARTLGLPVTTHVAESPDETAFLTRHAGPFRELWNRIGAWTNPPKREVDGPIGSLYPLLYYPLALLAHVNYCDDSDLDLLSRGVASVVYCPRTHAYFGHPPHRWREMLARQINVCVGTDSRASSPDLNLVDDLRLMHRIAPEVPPTTLWEMATIRGAKALGMERGWGTLAPGKDADCVVFPATTDDPLREVLEGPVLSLAVWAGGNEVLKAAR